MMETMDILVPDGKGIHVFLRGVLVSLCKIRAFTPLLDIFVSLLLEKKIS